MIVHGPPGDTREVVLFFSGRGEPIDVAFVDRPVVYSLGHCQIVAVPTDIAGEAQITDETCRFGAWQLDPEGSVSYWTTHTVRVSAQTTARLDPLPSVALRDGQPANPADLSLPAGESRLDLRWPGGPPDSPILLPDGACNVLELVSV